MEMVRKMEKLGTRSGATKKKVTIMDCQEVNE